MNRDQRMFLKALGLLGYFLVLMTAVLNAMFDQRVVAQVAPVVLIMIPLIIAFFYLGKKKDKQA